MALDKDGLEKGILAALVNMAGEQDSEGKMTQYAKDLADAINTYVRTGKVNVPGEGNKPVR